MLTDTQLNTMIETADEVAKKVSLAVDEAVVRANITKTTADNALTASEAQAKSLVNAASVAADAAFSAAQAVKQTADSAVTKALAAATSAAIAATGAIDAGVSAANTVVNTANAAINLAIHAASTAKTTAQTNLPNILSAGTAIKTSFDNIINTTYTDASAAQTAAIAQVNTLRTSIGSVVADTIINDITTNMPSGATTAATDIKNALSAALTPNTVPAAKNAIINSSLAALPSETALANATANAAVNVDGTIKTSTAVTADTGYQNALSAMMKNAATTAATAAGTTTTIANTLANAAVSGINLGSAANVTANNTYNTAVTDQARAAALAAAMSTFPAVATNTIVIIMVDGTPVVVNTAGNVKADSTFLALAQNQARAQAKTAAQAAGASNVLSNTIANASINGVTPATSDTDIKATVNYKILLDLDAQTAAYNAARVGINNNLAQTISKLTITNGILTTDADAIRTGTQYKSAVDTEAKAVARLTALGVGVSEDLAQEITNYLVKDTIVSTAAVTGNTNYLKILDRDIQKSAQEGAVFIGASTRVANAIAGASANQGVLATANEIKNSALYTTYVSEDMRDAAIDKLLIGGANESLVREAAYAAVKGNATVVSSVEDIKNKKSYQDILSVFMKDSLVQAAQKTGIQDHLSRELADELVSVDARIVDSNERAYSKIIDNQKDHTGQILEKSLANNHLTDAIMKQLIKDKFTNVNTPEFINSDKTVQELTMQDALLQAKQTLADNIPATTNRETLQSSIENVLVTRDRLHFNTLEAIQSDKDVMLQSTEALAGELNNDFKIVDNSGIQQTVEFESDGRLNLGKIVTGLENAEAMLDLNFAELKVGDNLTYVFNKAQEGSNDLNNAVLNQVGANTGQIAFFSIEDMRSAALGIDKINISDKFGAQVAIESINIALSKVSSQRSLLGAVQNRFEHTVVNLGTASENLTTAESRIRDLDMAKEITAFQKNNIIQQAGQAMLAQANQLPQGIVQLLK